MLCVLTANYCLGHVLLPVQNLDNWRAYNGRSYDFSLLDRNNGAGWDLAQKLLAQRNQYNRGRLSVEQALRHRYFLPELF